MVSFYLQTECICLFSKVSRRALPAAGRARVNTSASLFATLYPLNWKLASLRQNLLSICCIDIPNSFYLFCPKAEVLRTQTCNISYQFALDKCGSVNPQDSYKSGWLPNFSCAMPLEVPKRVEEGKQASARQSCLMKLSFWDSHRTRYLCICSFIL